MSQDTVRKLHDGLRMLECYDNPQTDEHRTRQYWSKGWAKVREAGVEFHAKYPHMHDWIAFAESVVDQKHWGILNHAWSGIGDWQA